jgi:DNA-binding Xre family transcriptional regulator
MTLGEIVSYYRHKRGISIRKLAEESDVSATYVSMIERDVTPIPSERCVRSILYNIGLDDIEIENICRHCGLVPKDVIKYISDNASPMVPFLRKLSYLSETDLEGLIYFVDKEWFQGH